MLTDTLNAEQAAAVRCDASLVVVIAGAGSGKTRMLAAKIATLLLEGHAPSEILAVTFTRKAAAELAERTRRLVEEHGDRRYDLPEIRTWHSWAAELLRRYPDPIGRTSDFTVYDEADREALVRSAARAVGAKNPDRGRLSRLEKDHAVAREVEGRLRRANALTFAQIEELTLRLLQNDRWAHQDALGSYRYVLVDEYQDTNLAQAAFAGHIVGQQLMVVGDPRQAIYEWRGATPELIADLGARDDAATFVLARCYRCPPEVIRLANEIAGPEHEPMRLPEGSLPEDPPELGAGLRVPSRCIDVGASVRACIEDAIAKGIEPSSIAVLARSWRELEALAPSVGEHELASPSSDPWSEDEHRRAVARLLRVAHNPSDDTLAMLVVHSLPTACRYGGRPDRMWKEALRRRQTVVRTCADYDPAWHRLIRLSSDAPLTHALDVAEELGMTLPDVDWSRWPTVEDFASWWMSRGLEADCHAEEQEHVLLTTVHGAKGREWDAVILADPRARTYGADTPEERRLLYVACTRARRVLYLCTRVASSPGPWGRGTDMMPDPSPLLPGWAT